MNDQQIRDFDVPRPPLDIQRELVAELEAERTLMDGNWELIARMEKKMRARLAEIQGEHAVAANEG